MCRSPNDISTVPCVPIWWWLVVVLLLMATTIRAERFHRLLIGDEIGRRLFVGSHFLFEDSDSLYLNGQRLTRGADYNFDSRLESFDLSGLTRGDGDTLEVICYRAPSWLVRHYRAAFSTTTGPTSDHPSWPAKPISALRPSPRSDVSVHGAKTFSLGSQTDGGNEFTQSLNLNLSGQLTPGVSITGSISDRSYDPSYGTVNSRLSELDKLHLKVASPEASLELGDLRFPPAFTLPPGKRVSGAAFTLDQPTWKVAAVVARPKGRYAKARLSGRDQIQGPYTVSSDGSFQAIVPGSETVWLDGSRLTAGSGKDYIMDYPTGRLTFMPGRSINRRSRIEVDYEPAVRDYEAEVYGGVMGLNTADSVWSLKAQWLLEGDDKSQPLLGELSAEDRQLLAGAGDGIAERSGVVTDSTGDYRLVSDSLPDSVYQYVGVGSGDFRVNFGYRGPGGGGYVYLGNGIYEFVGDGKGGYSPLVKLTPPGREQQFRGELRHNSQAIGSVLLEVDQTIFDANLLSDLYDDDNSGGAYRLTGQRDFGANRPLVGITYLVHYRQAEHRERSRLSRVDRSYRYLVPDNQELDTTDEQQYEMALALRPIAAVSITPSWGRLKFSDQFKASRYGVGVKMKAMGMTGNVDWHRILADGSDSLATWVGRANIVSSSVSAPVISDWRINLGHEYDRRWYGLLDSLGGTRHQRWRAELLSKHEKLGYEHFAEDTLDYEWRAHQTRQQLSASSDRRLRNLHYRVEFVEQWSQRATVTKRSSMGRLSCDYDDRNRRLHLGTTYLFSQESRNARGIRYLEVEPGRGEFVLEDGQYIPDPNGNLIHVQEYLSDQPTVRRGERGFDFRKVWTDVMISARTRVEEELLPEGERSGLWLIPFWTDESQPYLFYFHERRAETRLIEWKSFYAINISLSDNRESRRIGSVDLMSQRQSSDLTLKQTAREFYFEQAIRVFKSSRDAYYPGAGDIDGQAYRITAKRRFEVGEIGAAVSCRLAEATADDYSEQTSLRLFGRLHVSNHGQAEFSLEGYRQQLVGGQTASYALTDNRPGSRGAVWSLSVRMGDGSGLRADFRLSGRHADVWKPRITARAELVVGF